MAEKYLTYSYWLSRQTKLELCDRLALLSHVTGMSVTELLADPHRVLTSREQISLRDSEASLQNNWPLAYIVGTQPFYDLTFTVNAHCLIPRACTETLVEAVLQHTHPQESLSILDLGTGSGCIALTLAKHLPRSKVYGSDISPQALAIAEHNRLRLGITNCSFIESNWFEQIEGPYDILISNPPYVDTNDPRDLSTSYEPSLALFAKTNGTADLSHLIKEGVSYVKHYLVLEHAPWQAAHVRHQMLAQGYKHPTHLYNATNHHLRATKAYAPNYQPEQSQS